MNLERLNDEEAPTDGAGTLEAKLATLAEAARHASPGPWVAKITDGGTDIESSPTDTVVCTIDDGEDDQDPQAIANWDYLRLLDPGTVGELVRLARTALKSQARRAATAPSMAYRSFDEWASAQHLCGASPEATAAQDGWNAALQLARAIAAAASHGEDSIQAYAVLVDTELEMLMT